MEQSKRGKRRDFIKTSLQMLLSILLIFVLIGFFSNTFSTNCAKRDIISFKPHYITAQGESWALCSSKKPGGLPITQTVPYLIYQGDSQEPPEHEADVTGIYACSEKLNNDQETSQGISRMDCHLVMDRHFIIGEKRWFYTTDHAGQRVDRAFLKVSWKDKSGASHWEYVASEELSEEEKQQCREWIESGKPELETGRQYLRTKGEIQ